MRRVRRDDGLDAADHAPIVSARLAGPPLRQTPPEPPSDDRWRPLYGAMPAFIRQCLGERCGSRGRACRRWRRVSRRRSSAEVRVAGPRSEPETAADAADARADLFVLRGRRPVPAPTPGRSSSRRRRGRIAAVGDRTASVEPGSLREDGHVESLDARLRDASPNRDALFPLREAGIVVERRRAHHDTVRPRRALGCRPSVPGGRRPGPPRTRHAPTITSDHPIGQSKRDLSRPGRRR